jgi:hypothetical protein
VIIAGAMESRGTGEYRASLGLILMNSVFDGQ